MGRNAYLAVGTVFWIVATGLYVSSMLTKNWRSSDSDSYNLFDMCNFLGCTSFGWEPNQNNLYVFIPRILMLAAAVFIAIGMIFGLVGFCCDARCPTLTEGVLCIVGGLVIFAACAVFTGLTYNRKQLLIVNENFHYSFYLAWASGAVFIIAGSIICRAGSV